MNVKESKEYNLRTYRKEDEKDIISLFNKAYGHLAGFVPRTLEYWRWCILSRPDLSEEGIVLAVDTSRVVGYAAVERSGKILEFCCDPNCEGKTVVSELLHWCIDYAEDQGAGSASLNAPVQDEIVRQVCEELGFTEEPSPSLFLRVLDIAYVFDKILDQKKVKKGLDEAILINLRKFPSWCLQHVTILVQDGNMTISTEKLGHPTIEIEADISTISKCIFGSRRTLYRAILKRRLKIRPLRKILRAVKILSLFQLKNPPLYIPIADYG